MNEVELTNKIFDACVAVNPNITNQDSFWMLNAILLAIRPTCQRIECLTAALRGLVDALDEDGDSGIESKEILRLRSILGDF